MSDADRSGAGEARLAGRVRLATALVAVGLGVQAATLLSPSYVAFLTFAGVGVASTVAGMALFATLLRRR